MHEIELTKFPLKDENDHKSYDQMFSNTSNNDGIYIDNNSNTNASSSASFGQYNDTTGKGKNIFSSNTSNDHFQVQEIEMFRVNV